MLIGDMCSKRHNACMQLMFLKVKAGIRHIYRFGARPNFALIAFLSSPNEQFVYLLFIGFGTLFTCTLNLNKLRAPRFETK